MDLLWCICIILVLIFIHILWPKFVYDPKYDKYKVADVSKYPPDIKLRTGDIVLFRSCVKCKYKDSIMDDAFMYIYKNAFDSFRWYIIDQQQYTHTGVVIRLNNKPYIVHIDGGSPMFDELEQRWIAQTSCVVTGMNHLDDRGGIAHVYRYNGPEINKDMMPWVMKNRKTTYPKSLLNLIKVNGFGWGTHPDGVSACTDFVESTLHHIGILNKEDISRHASLSDIFSIVMSNPNYEHVPVVLKNKCYINKHFQ